MGKNTRIMDGNEACAYIAYPFTEVAAIYPITPSSTMAELTDEWSAKGLKNIFDQRVNLVQMQSEAGAVGAIHGALETGALATTYTSSQGLMLMIPTMHRISGQLQPGVIHVASRSVGTHAFSIFGDHSDVMNCRQTGFAMLSSGSVQEVMDLGAIAHLSAIRGRIPFLHFFDGFRTSHEIQKIEAIDYDDLKGLIDYNALQKFRDKALNPEHPVQRSTVQNGDIYFQVREASNRFYDNLPEIVEDYMNDIFKLTGRKYRLFDYYGNIKAEYVVVAMGSVSGTIREVVESLEKFGDSVGFIQVHLYRPFSEKHLRDALPKTVKKIAVLDRTKESGAIGEPLYQDIATIFSNDDHGPKIYGGRYGLSSKDTTPNQIKAVFDNLLLEKPKNNFTIGIDDDLTFHSLHVGDQIFYDKEITSCKIWGLGGDGTIGANKNSIKILGEHTDLYVQGYFEFDAKKSLGLTKSHLRFGKSIINSSYYVNKADLVACHNETYLDKYKMVQELKPGGTFLLNSKRSKEELTRDLPCSIKGFVARNRIEIYVINASKIAFELGLGNRINTILQSAFFKLIGVIPEEKAISYMKKAVFDTYNKKGDEIVSMNYLAIDRGILDLKKIDIPRDWKDCVDEDRESLRDKNLPDIIRDILIPMNEEKGNDLPVSAFKGLEDGTMPLGTAAYEKRGIASAIPIWNKDFCIQCNQCSLVCPHGVIRPYLLDEGEEWNAPENYQYTKALGKGLDKYSYTLQVSTKDCTSCGLCADICPKNGKALKMEPLNENYEDVINWNYSLSIKEKEESLSMLNVKGSQFKKPLLEFSAACSGCGETPYIKLLTQLYGDKMYIANATGCTQAWGAAMPSVPYTTTKEGRGPAWSNSLFENNAEFSLGMTLGVKQQREKLFNEIEILEKLTLGNSELNYAIENWKETFEDLNKSQVRSRELLEILENLKTGNSIDELVKSILNKRDHFTKKTMWMVGGDGWAYDIGYGGLDHVFSLGEDLNVLIVDTEMYSNTGGQQSKATQIGTSVKFAASGKKTAKKDLGALLMTYENIYVAQVAMGADQNQLLKALNEAENYKGPSVVIAYAPCVIHGIKGGMVNSQKEMKKAVQSGYWTLYRYNPSLDCDKLIVDSKEPISNLQSFLKGETRFKALEKTFPKEALKLFREAEERAKEKYLKYPSKN